MQMLCIMCYIYIVEWEIAILLLVGLLVFISVNLIVAGIDDSETECDLDDVKNWDVVLENSDDSDIEAMLRQLLDLIS